MPYSAQSEYPQDIKAVNCPAGVTTELFPATTLGMKIVRIEFNSEGDLDQSFQTMTVQVKGGGAVLGVVALTGESHNGVIGGFEAPAGGMEVVSASGNPEIVTAHIYSLRP
jgi:hypothetical protein